MTSDIKNLSLRTNSIPIPNVKHAVHFDVTVTSILSKIPHVSQVLNCLNGAFKYLYLILRVNKPTPPKVTIFCYKQLMTSLTIFEFIFWTDISFRQMEGLRFKERQILRHYTSILKNDDGSKYISKQILYDTSERRVSMPLWPGM